MKKRIFVGTMTSPSFQQSVLSWKQNYNDLPVRWILPANLHLTLIPPWYESDINSIQDTLQTISFRSFSLSFCSISVGPDRQPRLIWTIGKESPELSKLKKLLEKTLKRKAEKRLFIPHITIARFGKETKNISVHHAIDWRQNVSAITLFESHLSPTGATYTPISKFPFSHP
ncbi:RNA 2',3'-cyclic phosphodiesterase [Candidatus Gottesmanbacteria bacterium]|nr:RNA 2',3'-cyclic phosphodiesterase [Candidatus Gottesmanbacteria bacterium]